MEIYQTRKQKEKYILFRSDKYKTDRGAASIENGGKLIFCLLLKLEVALLHNRTLVIKLLLHRHLATLTTSTQPIYQQILRRQGCLVCLLCFLISHNGEKHSQLAIDYKTRRHWIEVSYIQLIKNILKTLCLYLKLLKLSSHFLRIALLLSSFMS